MTDKFPVESTLDNEATIDNVHVAHLYLDRLYIPREYAGQVLSLVGRLGILRRKLSYRTRMFAHHALWGGIYEGLLDERLEAFGVKLANRIADTVADSLAIPFPPVRFRHRKRRSTYEKIGVAEVQATHAIAEGDKLVIYRSEKDGKLWARPESEFDDGRFERIDHASEYIPEN